MGMTKNDCDALRVRFPELGQRPCCRFCHDRADFTPARVHGHALRVCCIMWTGLYRADNIGLDTLGPDDDFDTYLDDLASRFTELDTGS